jgi:hypothetical protein
LFAPSDTTEILIQEDTHIALYNLTLNEETGNPEVEMTWSIDEIPDLTGELHSGIRKDD